MLVYRPDIEVRVALTHLLFEFFPYVSMQSAARSRLSTSGAFA